MVASARQWTETVYGGTGWKQNLRSLINPFQGGHTVKYGRINMSPAAAASVITTSLGDPEDQYIISVCLDHRLRICYLNTGHVTDVGDILGTERNPQETGKWTIDPTQANLVRIDDSEGGTGQLLVTYSPVGAGEFKIWHVTRDDYDRGSVIVKDVFENAQLVPIPPTSADVWTLADFGILPRTETGLQLWLLWKNNMTYRVQKVQLKKEDPQRSWQEGTRPVYSDMEPTSAEGSGPLDPVDVTEKWLDIILCPGRFTRPTLETALAVHEGESLKEASAKAKAGLADAISLAVSRRTSLVYGHHRQSGYAGYRKIAEDEWRRFYRLVRDFNRQRGEALSLALDHELGMTWVVCADRLSAIRECSSLETMMYIQDSRSKEEEEVRSLLMAGTGLLEGFPDSQHQLCKALLRAEMFESSPRIASERVSHFYNRSGLWGQISDEDCNQVTELLGPKFDLATKDLYDRTFELIESTQTGRQRRIRYPLSEFGSALVVRVVHEMCELQWRMCFSQVVLLAHMVSESEQEEHPSQLHATLDLGAIFLQLIDALKRIELLTWLARTELTLPAARGDKHLSRSGDSTGPDETRTLTVLEASLGYLLGVSDLTNEGLSESITDLASNLCAPDSDTVLNPAFMQGSLLKRDRVDLAAKLAPFADQDPFSTYAQGRVALAMRDFDAAATHFKQAAVGLSKNSPIDSISPFTRNPPFRVKRDL